MRIFLLGFMGAGKSTLGSLVAKKLQVPFYDTDEMIEAQEAETISSIFSDRGEDAFRNIEAGILRKTSAYDKALIATGGGLPVYYHNMAWLMDHGITMYLELPEDILLPSLIYHRESRPLLAGLTPEDAAMRALTLIEERKPFYDQAAITLSLTGEHDADVELLTKACKYIW